MTEPSKLLGRALDLGRSIDPQLDDRDVERLRRQARFRSGRSTLTPLRVAIAIAIAAAALLIAGSREVWLRRTKVDEVATRPRSRAVGTGATAPAASAEAPRPGATLPAPLVLSDRSTVQPRDGSTELSIVEDSARSARITLSRGRAHFEVTPRAERVFSVMAAGVEVTVLGTVFDVEVVADRVGVEVERGSVRVDWKLGARQLTVGESGWFPPLVLDDSKNARSEVDDRRKALGRASQSRPAFEPARVASAPAADRAAPLAAADSSAEAGAQAESAQELLKLADAARARGDAALGAELLRRVLRDHAKDPRAPLAALTLGRLLLRELHRPAEAAAAFEQVELLAPGSPFAEDALAHQAEAWFAAGQLDKARQFGAAYLQRYPTGRHAQHMKALTGNE